MKGARPVKLSGLHHSSACVEFVFPCDSRFTRCELCGKHRYYPKGYNGEVNYISKPKGGKTGERLS